MDVYKSEKPYHKTLFLLAREHFKINKIEQAQGFLNQGFELADVEYTHHLRILRAQYDENYKQNLETTIADGLDYFESQKLYGFMEEYSGILAKNFIKKVIMRRLANTLIYHMMLKNYFRREVR